MAHDRQHSTGLYPLSARPVHAFLYPEMRATPAQHHYAYQAMHPAPSGEHRTYLDVALGLQPRPTTQLQGTELRPRAIHYADDTVVGAIHYADDTVLLFS